MRTKKKSVKKFILQYKLLSEEDINKSRSTARKLITIQRDAVAVQEKGQFSIIFNYNVFRDLTCAFGSI